MLCKWFAIELQRQSRSEFLVIFTIRSTGSCEGNGIQRQDCQEQIFEMIIQQALNEEKQAGFAAHAEQVLSLQTARRGYQPSANRASRCLPAKQGRGCLEGSYWWEDSNIAESFKIAQVSTSAGTALP